ncbi:hypothetical protein CONLIGDRAFT_443210 [Coniochaeta ligniaria NRRL 30616]|uniref:Uncharacterized protein n=1 Tax=Coniochaeta ligniaria NRRL 30616 TaxID=1408157 RepID=A0A1J7JD58_9PEZI|nr:hypothetical protein CONLIGDRAFT_443210 [Coniochaeta ligniaria NRRL 30616]
MTTWGLSVVQMRQLFFTQIRSIISYACAAWFVYSHATKSDMKFALQQKALKVLESVYRKCLLHISGAFRTTSSAVLCRELDIKPLPIWLEEVCLVKRAGKIWLSEQWGGGRITDPWMAGMKLGRVSKPGIP